jgi:Chaperone of endosialidase
MRSPMFPASLVIVAVIFAAPTNAQFADDNVKSDGYGNTAAGTDALFALTPSNESSLGCGTSASLCISNTALGNNALYNNMSGSDNVAVGAGALYMNMTGGDNVAIGLNALYNNNDNANTAVGYTALGNNTGGSENTAVGVLALSQNQNGTYNTATGHAALFYNDQGGAGGSYNTADGAGAMGGNASGQYNTAVGSDAMLGAPSPTFGTGSYNTAIGFEALFSYSTGAYNTASGVQALYSNTTADYNTASGYQALYKTNAVSNTASGYQALYADTSGANNTATGVHALASNTSGSNNIAEGWHGGYNLTTGSNNIDIGSPGVAADSGVIRIGTITGMTSTQSATYIAGIYGKTSSGGLPVVIDSNGLLGTTTSSARFKTAIEPMGSNTAKLQQLRPVTFHLKSDPTGAVQYGLIAEEVAKVYPELVVRDANGRIDGVRYDELSPMLLNELQQQHTQLTQKIAAQGAEIADLKQQVAELSDLKQELHAALETLKVKDQVVAQR